MAGSSSQGAAKKVLFFLIFFGIVCYMGFEDLRHHRESQEKNEELDSIYKELQVARHGKEELERVVAELIAEKNELKASKSNTSSQLVRTEINKRELADEKVKLEEVVNEREKQIEGLKEQLEVVQESAKEVVKLKKRLHELEEQLELFKANTTMGSSSDPSIKHEESLQEVKKQGVDLEHGLSASDKADDQVAGGEEVDDRKRETGGDGESAKGGEGLGEGDGEAETDAGDSFSKGGEAEAESEAELEAEADTETDPSSKEAELEGEGDSESDTGSDSSSKGTESESDSLSEDLDTVKAAAIR